MPRRIGEDVRTIQLARPQGQDQRLGGPHVLDHDVEVNLLRDSRIGPGRLAVVGSELECQAGMLRG